MPKEKTVISTYSVEMVLMMIRWIRNDEVANNLFNYRQIKEGGGYVTEQELIDLFVKNHNITTTTIPTGYSILQNTEN